MKKRLIDNMFKVFLLAMLMVMCLSSLTYATMYSDNIVPGSGGTGSASSGSDVHLAFDGNLSTEWNPYYLNPFDSCWLMYEFPTPRTVTKFSIQSKDIYTNLPVNFNFEGYNESTHSWVILKTVNETSITDNKITHEVNNVNSYKKYRINIPSYFFVDLPGLAEFEMYETIGYDEITSSVSGKNTNYTQDFTFPAAKTVKKIKFNLNNITNATLPTSYKIEGYNASGQWITLSSTGSVGFGANELILNNSTAYQKYRVNLQFNQACAVNLEITGIYGLN